MTAHNRKTTPKRPVYTAVADDGTRYRHRGEYAWRYCDYCGTDHHHVRVVARDNFAVGPDYWCCLRCQTAGHSHPHRGRRAAGHSHSKLERPR